MVEEEKKEEITEELKPKVARSFNIKPFLIGVPLFIIQLIVVYFVTANILMEKMAADNEDDLGEYLEKVVNPSKTDEDGVPVELGKFTHSFEDIIVNPALSGGNQLLLTSITFDVPTEENKKELEAKGFIINDLIISILSSKYSKQLSDNNFKDSLRTEIADEIESKLPGMKINKVYFNKYIMQ